MLASAQALWQASAAAPAAPESTSGPNQEEETAAALLPCPSPIAVAAAAQSAAAATLAAAFVPNRLVANQFTVDLIQFWQKNTTRACDFLLFDEIALFHRSGACTPASKAGQILTALPVLDGLKIKLAVACALGAPGPALTIDDETRLANAWHLLTLVLVDICAGDPEHYFNSALREAAVALYEALATPLGYALPHLTDASQRAALTEELEEEELGCEGLDRGVLQWLGHEIDLSRLAFSQRDAATDAPSTAFLAPPLLLFDPDCCGKLSKVRAMHAQRIQLEAFRLFQGVAQLDEVQRNVASGAFEALSRMRQRLRATQTEINDIATAEQHGLRMISLILCANALLERAPRCIDASDEEVFAWRALAKTVRRVAPDVERMYVDASLDKGMDHLVEGAPEGYLADLHRRYRDECQSCVAQGEALRMPAALKVYEKLMEEVGAAVNCILPLVELTGSVIDAVGRGGDRRTGPSICLPARLSISILTGL